MYRDLIPQHGSRLEILTKILHILRTKHLPPACREFLAAEAARLAG